MSNIFSFFIPYKDIFIECKYILLNANIFFIEYRYEYIECKNNRNKIMQKHT